jgi:hypothetical protein
MRLSLLASLLPLLAICANSSPLKKGKNAMTSRSVKVVSIGEMPSDFADILSLGMHVLVIYLKKQWPTCANAISSTSWRTDSVAMNIITSVCKYGSVSNCGSSFKGGQVCMGLHNEQRGISYSRDINSKLKSKILAYIRGVVSSTFLFDVGYPPDWLTRNQPP